MPRSQNKTFSRAIRGNLFPKHKKEVPSVWQYNPKQAYEIYNQSRGYTIQGKNSGGSYIQKNNTPGPGNYPILNRWVRFPIYYIHIKKNLEVFRKPKWMKCLVYEAESSEMLI